MHVYIYIYTKKTCCVPTMVHEPCYDSKAPKKALWKAAEITVLATIIGFDFIFAD